MDRLTMKKPQHQQHGSGTRFIPDDLLIDGILKRLPVQSLQRFQLVSKLWYSTICSPLFIAAYEQHCNRNRNRNRKSTAILLLYKNYVCIHHYYHNDDDNDNKYNDGYSTPTPTPSSSCNPISLFPELSLHNRYCKEVMCYRTCYTYSEGILCLLIPAPPMDDPSVPYYREKIILINPILCKALTLPTSYDHFSYTINDITLVNKLQCWYLIFGFGYDKLSCDYKVVRATLVKGKYRSAIRGSGTGSGTLLRANVYSLNAKSWRTFDIFDPPCRVKRVRGLGSTYSGVHVNGVLYWTFGDCLLAFRLWDEVFEYHKLPEQVSNFDNIKLIAIKFADDEGDEKNNHIKLGLVTHAYQHGFHALWVMMESSQSVQSETGVTNMSWMNLLKVKEGTQLANYFDVKMVDGQLTLVKNNHGQWTMSHLKSENEIFASLKNECEHGLRYRFRVLVSPFEESLVGVNWSSL